MLPDAKRILYRESEKWNGLRMRFPAVIAGVTGTGTRTVVNWWIARRLRIHSITDSVVTLRSNRGSYRDRVQRRFRSKHRLIGSQRIWRGGCAWNNGGKGQ